MREGDDVLVEFVDNGPGIPPEIQTKIFDPFFTTKPMGEGTGLGLDTVYRIVRKHHGNVSVVSQPGEHLFSGAAADSEPADLVTRSLNVEREHQLATEVGVCARDGDRVTAQRECPGYHLHCRCHYWSLLHSR